jgi:Ca2+-binding EF-hand superfamily protein
VVSEFCDASVAFQAVDKNRDGVISVEEFKLFFECLGLEEKV